MDGSNLGFSTAKINIWWQGKSGLKVKDVIAFLRTLLKYENHPNILILHVGGNDIGQIPLKQLRDKMLTLVKDVSELLPNTTLVWSQILPRLVWRNEISHSSLEKSRIRLNSMIATMVLRMGGKYIRYPEIRYQDVGLFSDDVHFSHIGNDIFLYRLQQALQNFMMTDTCLVSPPSGEFGPWLCF